MRGPLASIALATILISPAAINEPSENTKYQPAPVYRMLELDGTEVSWKTSASEPVAEITYAFLEGSRSFPTARNCSAMTSPMRALAPSRIVMADFRREVRAAFEMWSDVAAVDFREVSDEARAGILIGSQVEPRGRAFTNVATAAPDASRISQSLICLNPETPWKIGFDGNLKSYDLRYTMAHEIGHALGLDHPNPEGQLMSYRYAERKRGLEDGDIAGAVAIYGARGKVPLIAGTEEAQRVTARQRGASAAFGLGPAKTEESASHR